MEVWPGKAKASKLVEKPKGQINAVQAAPPDGQIKAEDGNLDIVKRAKLLSTVATNAGLLTHLTSVKHIRGYMAELRFAQSTLGCRKYNQIPA